MTSSSSVEQPGVALACVDSRRQLNGPNEPIRSRTRPR